MITRTMHALLPLAAVVFVAPALAQQPRTPASLEDVLKGVEAFGAAADQAFNERKAEFESKSQAEKDALLRSIGQLEDDLDSLHLRMRDQLKLYREIVGRL